MKRITVLAGGWSASQMDLRKLPGYVIAVNDAAIYAPRVDAVLSMDRLWTENRFAAVAKFGVPVHLRREALKNVSVVGLAHVYPFECDHTSTTLSDQPGTLNGTHSGFCAFNLAYQMRPQSIFLVGFDMALGPRGERHWFPDYPWKGGGGSSASKLAEWSGQFDRAAEQLLRAGIKAFVAGSPKTPRCFLPIDRARLEAEAACAG
jgi:hypothetical protein